MLIIFACALSMLFPSISVEASHMAGFSSQTKELQSASAKITGTIPAWLSGKVFSVGPAIFEMGSSKATYWLDGLAMIHQFSINAGTVTYSNKKINSDYYQECCALRAIKGSAPQKKKSMWSKLNNALSTESSRTAYDNTNINLALFNNELVCLTETPHAQCIDSNTLRTKGHFKYADQLEPHIACAHPLIDPVTGILYSTAIQYAHTSSYLIYTMAPTSAQRTLLATIPVGYPSYMHSFSLSKDYLILVEYPLCVSPYDLLMSDSSYLDNFIWKPKNGTTITLIDKKSGKTVATFKTEPFFSLHHINAYQKDSLVLVDLIAYNDSSIIKSFYFNTLATKKLPRGTARRLTLDIPHRTVTSTMLSPQAIETPSINPQYRSKPYRYIYATTSPDGVKQNLCKIDLKTGAIKEWGAPSCYASEPIFVSMPKAKEEDQGIILALVLDATAKKSFVLFLDAMTFTELARATLDQHVPFTMHGIFLPLVSQKPLQQEAARL